ncbi:restriction endonuclease subunit S [Planococcus glaciei]|nr:restriction endonuclease subunit S [Planococcus glaciei]QDY45684.1 restriction endonuclease subunit S [Planococcus glaciei]
MESKGWKKYALGDVCSVTDCQHKTAPIVKEETQYRMLRTTNIRNGKIDAVNTRSVSQETYLKWSIRGFLEEGDVILTREAPMGEVGIIRKEKYNLFLGQRLLQLKANKNLITPEFLFYSLQGRELQHQIRMNEGTGSVVSNIRIPILKKMEIYVPDLNEQKRIVDTLKAMDEKIVLNELVIANLEKLIQTLFKRWFVDFEFPNEYGKLYKSSGGKLEESELGLKPSEWKVIEIGDLALQISKGTTPTKKDFDSATGAKKIDFLKVKDINDDGLINFNSVEKIPEVIHEKKLKRSILLEKDILLSIAGTIGRVSYISKIRNGININQALAFIRLHDSENHFAFIYTYLKTKKFQNEINSKIVQGVQANISLSVIKKSLVVFPNIEVLNQYNEIIIPILKQIEILKEEKHFNRFNKKCTDV